MNAERPFAKLRKLLHSDKASILIVSLGLLTALVIMATTFATLQRVESRSAKNFGDRVEALHLATATLQYSVERLRTAGLVYNSSFVNLGAAHNAYTPDPANFSGYYNFSLSLPTSDPALTGVCDVRMLDGSSQIYIGRTAGSLATERIQSVLAALMLYINAYQSPKTALDSVNDAAGIYAAMLAGGYNSKSQLLSLGLTGTAAQRQDKYDALRDYLTVYPSIDSSAVKPDLTSQPRAPINLNSVAGAVLVALLSPLLSDDLAQGSYPFTAEERLADLLTINRPFLGWKKPALPSPNPRWFRITQSGFIEGKGFVDLLNEAAVETFMIPYYSGGVTAWRTDRDRVIANFFPNSFLSYGNPSYGVSKGKDQVASGTTEFSLKSSGLYEILLMTHIYGPPSNTIYSERQFEAVVRTHELWKQSTQAEFLSGATFTTTQILTYPEHASVAAGGSATDGYLGLAPNELTGDAPYFRVSYNTNFTAEVSESPPGGAGTTQAGSNINDTIPVSDAGVANYPGELAADGVYLSREGANRLIDNGGDDSSEQIYYQGGVSKGKGSGGNQGKGKGGAPGKGGSGINIDPTTGTLSFWIKLAFNPTVTEAERQLFFYPTEWTGGGPPAFTLPGRLKLWVQGNGTNLQLLAEYLGVDPVLFTPVTLSTAQNIPVWKKGEWHHVGMTWESNDGAGGSFLQTFADGVASTTDTDVVLDPGVVPDQTDVNNRIRFGCTVNTGAAAQETGTIDEIRSWQYPNAGIATDPGMDRYFGTASPQFTSGAFPSAAGKVPYPLIVATTSWTEYLPPDGGTANIQVDVGVDMDGDALFSDVPPPAYPACGALLSNVLDDGAGGLLTWPGVSSPLIVNAPATGSLGVALKYRVTITPPATVDTYPGSPYGAGAFARRVDTPILDDIVTTVLRAPKLHYWHEILPP
ncbi:MAG: hypothetical protein HYU36_21225 [Planctomycetes bacterium]|nr:hypothetical protein [Planctomycetota bacterium]